MTTEKTLKKDKRIVHNQLTKRLALLILPLVFVFIVGALFFSYSQLYQFQENKLNNDLLIQHKFEQANISQWAYETSAILDNFATIEGLENQYDEIITPNNKQAITEGLRSLTGIYELTDKKYFDIVFLVNDAGLITASSDENFLNFSIRYDYIFVSLILQGKSGKYFIEDINSVFNQQSIIHISSLSTDIGNPNGALVGISEIDVFIDLLNDTEIIFPEGNLFVVSEDESYYLYDHENRSIVLQNLSELQRNTYKNMFPIMMSEDAGTVYANTIGFENEEVVTVFTWNEALNIGLGNNYSPTIIRSNYYFNFVVFSMITIVFFILLSFFINNSSKKIMRPIQQIINANERISVGNWDIQLPSLANKEMAILSESYIRMIENFIKTGVAPKDMLLTNQTASVADLPFLTGLLTNTETEFSQELELSEQRKSEFIIKEENFNKKIDFLETEISVYQGIVAELDSKRLLNECVATINKQFSINSFNIYLLDKDSKFINLVAGTDLTSNVFVKESTSLKFDETSTIGWGVSNRITRLKETQVENLNDDKILSELIIPIVYNQSGVGALVLASTEETLFSKEFISFMENIAENLGKVLEISQLFSALQENLLEQASVIEGLNSIEENGDVSYEKSDNDGLAVENFEMSHEAYEEMQVRILNLTNDQQMQVTHLINELNQINSFDSLLKSIVKNIGSLPDVSQSTIHTYLSQNDSQNRNKPEEN